LQNLEFVGSAIDPTYVAESNKKRIYAITKVKDDQGNVTGGFVEWDGTSNDFPLKPIASIHDQETSPAYISVDEDKHLVFTANYHAGTINSYKIGEDGSITKADRIMDKGTLGFRKEQLDRPTSALYQFNTRRPNCSCRIWVSTRSSSNDLEDSGKIRTPLVNFKCKAVNGPATSNFDAKEKSRLTL